ncbi:hypothetical protein [Streptomyces litchfieldiae]|uniref:Uncharacterized protein n=1 Tax=Streptomyces litchfieldiae TaxID=3075543 RepID=A0ABU2MNP6_9ACTN|nr:hypothetical protein [Streptomyces sp. DSM 44938]MDT0343234.1 hypothetical protein [Streptomyces sp. DSM 44938]
MMSARFEVSDGFRALPLGMSADEALTYVRQRIGNPEFGAEEVDRKVIGVVHTLSRGLRAAGTLYVGGAQRIINGERSLATLLVAAQKFAYGDDRAVAAEGAMQALVAARGKGWTGSVYDLPCGPGAVVMGGHEHPIPPLESGKPTLNLPMAELMAFVPVPDDPSLSHQYMLTATFTTPSIRHWEAYMPAMVRLLRSITFTSTASEERHRGPE